MKKINFKNLTLAALMIGAAGCNDFLQQPTPGKLDASEFFATDTDALQSSIAIYDRLSAHYYTNWASSYMVKMMPSDESTAGGTGSGDQTGYQNLDDFTTDSQNDKVAGVWQQLYNVIQKANATIDNVPGTTDVQKRVIAEAKALRAYAYFDLVNLWGEVPLIVHPPDPVNFLVARSAKADTYLQIEKDLTEAIAVLPLKSEYTAADRFRVSKGTAQALLGKVYMYESASVANGGLGVDKWAAAATSLQAVIDSHEYALESGLGKTFSKAGEFGVESLFEASFIDYAYNWGNFPWGGAPESNIHIQLMGPRGDFFTPAPGDSLIGGWGFNLATNVVYDAMEANDGRKGQTIMSLAEFQAEGGAWTGATSWKFAGYFQRKYTSYSNETNGTAPNTPELNYGTNFRLIRYADVLLLAAEAYHNSGGDAAALPLVNQVRQRTGTHLPAINVSGAPLMDAIIKERLVELAFEGHRFQDLVRWGLATQYLPAGYNPAKHNLLPVPYADVLSAGLTQNPNYQ